MPPLSLDLPPALAALSDLRVRLDRWAREAGIDPFPTTLVAVELVANAIDATPEGARVHVSVTKDDDRVEVRVTDHGDGFDPSTTGADLGAAFPPPSQERGRGLYLVRQLSQDLRMEREEGRTIVLAVLLVDRAEGPAHSSDRRWRPMTDDPDVRPPQHPPQRRG